LLATSLSLPFPVTLAPLDNGQLHLAIWGGEPLNGYNQLLTEYAYVGDVNLDGLVNGLDIQPFVDLLLDSAVPGAATMKSTSLPCFVRQ
jgi:hypothetical protein